MVFTVSFMYNSTREPRHGGDDVHQRTEAGNQNI